MFDESQLTYHTVQLLNEEGFVREEEELYLSNELLINMYQWMKKARIIDEKLMKMQRQGRIGTYAPFSGQEAAQVGSALALEKSDWLCPSYRDTAACLVHGMPIEQLLYTVKGHVYGGKTPENINILPIQIIIAAQTLHAVGIAHASKIKGESSVSVSYFGDGATSEGDFHEALNFAAVYKVPTIFFCQNNQYAISVPLEKQMASRSIAQKAIAYGMKGVQVDGNDILAVYQVMKEAAERARNGEGPTLIEAITYRYGPHTTSDDPTKYRERDEVDGWIQKKDPIHRLNLLLERKGLWSPQEEEQLEQRFKEELDTLINRMEEEESPTIEETFHYVYQEMLPHLQEQKEMAKRIQKRKMVSVNE